MIIKDNDFNKLKKELEDLKNKTFGLYEIDDLMQEKGFGSELGESTALLTVGDLDFLDRFQDDFGGSYILVDEENNFEVKMYCQFEYEITDICNLDDWKKEPNDTKISLDEIEIRIKSVNIHK